MDRLYAVLKAEQAAGSRTRQREGIRQEEEQKLQWFEKLAEYKIFLESVESIETKKVYPIYLRNTRNMWEKATCFVKMSLD